MKKWPSLKSRKKNPNQHFIKEDVWSKHKKIQHHMSLGTRKWKKWGINVMQLEWPKPKTLVTPNAWEDLEKGISHSLLVGKQNCTTTYKRVYQGLLMLHIRSFYNAYIGLFDIYPEKVAMCSHKNSNSMFIVLLALIPDLACNQDRFQEMNESTLIFGELPTV